MCFLHMLSILSISVKFCYKKNPGKKTPPKQQHIHKETYVHIYAHEYREAGIGKQNDERQK